MRDLRLAVIKQDDEQCSNCLERLEVGRVVAVEDGLLLCDFHCWAKWLGLNVNKSNGGSEHEEEI